jgi:LysM repeat protein
MGLFSFLKNAGAKVFGKEEKEEMVTMSSEEFRLQKLNLLSSVVGALNLPIEDLSLDLDDDVVTVYGQAESQKDKEKVILALGNVEGIGAVDDRISVVLPEPEADFYEVKSGDSLSKIAKEFYGDAMKYNEIFEANQPMLTDPNKIYPGQVLRIPKLG